MTSALKTFKHLFICREARLGVVCATEYVRHPRGQYPGVDSPSTVWVPGFELRSSGLVVNLFTG